MAGTNTNPVPITVFRVVGSSDALPQTFRMSQAATQTFKRGTPLSLSSGSLQATATINGTSVVIAGFSDQAGDNLSTAGTAPQGGSGTTFGNVPGQTGAVNIPIGAPPADGSCGVLVANDLTIFQGVTDTAHTLAQAVVGTIYGLTKDTASGLWFVDTTITTSGGGACVIITDLIGAVGAAGGLVGFKVTGTYQQINQ